METIVNPTMLYVEKNQRIKLYTLPGIRVLSEFGRSLKIASEAMVEDGFHKRMFGPSFLFANPINSLFPV
jgi:hypothetical protein